VIVENVNNILKYKYLKANDNIKSYIFLNTNILKEKTWTLTNFKKTTNEMLKEAVCYINEELQSTESAIYDIFAILRSSRINSAEQLSSSEKNNRNKKSQHISTQTNEEYTVFGLFIFIVLY